jgi:hypothetical protein
MALSAFLSAAARASSLLRFAPHAPVEFCSVKERDRYPYVGVVHTNIGRTQPSAADS